MNRQQEQTYDLVRYAFNKSNTKERREAFQLLSDHSYTYIKEQGEQVTSHFVATPFNMRLNDHMMTMAGIGYVATLPEFRGNGDIHQLFRELFDDLHEKQIAVSFLAPFSQTFYRHLGYENVCNRFVYHFKSDAIPLLPKIKDGSYERHLFNEAVYDKMQHIYQSTLGIDNGSLQRPTWWYQYKQLKFPESYVVFYHYPETNEDSYMLYHFDNQHFIIDELAYHNRHELIALLQFAGRHQMTVTDFYLEDPRQHLQAVFSDSIPIQTEVKPYMMARIQDFQLFIQPLLKKMTLSHPCYLEISDDMCPWNNGLWELDATGVTKIDDENSHHYHAHYRGNIQAFSQLLISGYSLQQLSYGISSITTLRPHPAIEEWRQDPIHLYDYF